MPLAGSLHGRQTSAPPRFLFKHSRKQNMPQWTITTKSLGYCMTLKVCWPFPWLFEEKGIWKRRQLQKRPLLWSNFIFPITGPPGRAQFSQPCPRVSTFRKHLIKGAEKRVQSSTISLLSWNIHSPAPWLRWYTSSQIFRFCVHSVLCCGPLVLVILNLTSVLAFIPVNLLPVYFSE